MGITTNTNNRSHGTDYPNSARIAAPFTLGWCPMKISGLIFGRPIPGTDSQSKRVSDWLHGSGAVGIAR
jgi:hypothetical protein